MNLTVKQAQGLLPLKFDLRGKKKKISVEKEPLKIVGTAPSYLPSYVFYIPTISQMDLFSWSRGLPLLLSMRFIQSNELSIMLLLSQRRVGADRPLQQVIHPILRQWLYR